MGLLINAAQLRDRQGCIRTTLKFHTERYAPHLREFLPLKSVVYAGSQVNHCHQRHRDLPSMRIEYGDRKKSRAMKTVVESM